MSQIAGLQFGSGIVLASPTGGNLATDPTPLEVGVVQNVKCTFGAEIKELYGQTQWSLDSAVGKRSIKGSFEFAQISNDLLSQLFFADSTTAGVILTAYREPGQVPATTTYTITVANAAHYTADFGVTYAATGVPLTDVGSSGSLTAAGQYQVDVATGVYTFYSGDASANLLISYQYSSTTGGTTLTAGNHPMGFGPIVSLALVFPYDGIGIGFNFPYVRLGKIDIATKIDDYAMLTTDFSAFAGATNNPFTSFQAW